MGLSEVVPVLERAEPVPVFVDVHTGWRLPELSPERPVVPLDLPVVLRRIRRVSDAFDSHAAEERRETRSEFPAAIRPYPGDLERRFPDEVPNELRARPDGMFRVRPGESETRAVVRRVVLGFLADPAEWEARVHLDFAPGFVQGTGGFPSPAPFARVVVPDAVPAEYPEGRGLVGDGSGKFRVPEGEPLRSFVREVPRQRADFLLDAPGRPVLRGTGFRSRLLRHEAGFAFDPVFRREFPERPFGYPEHGGRILSGPFPAGMLGCDPDFRFDHVGAAVTDGHGTKGCGLTPAS